ncbi:hypothetical protein E6O75_ATG09056 [Venturia nashicola]|uniref:Uncharacterized protein n=1 Tax=Venturia nashicola TaxID=86259 RepID=A0A4Z1P303_9PEZI|nr:hypothetical protein E6O75_ATG09056 [Venturia nashicola]
MVEEGEDIGVELRGFKEIQVVDEALRGSEDDIGVPILRDKNNDLGEVVVREDEDVLVKVEDDSKAKTKKRKLQDSPGDGSHGTSPIRIRKTKKRAKKKDAIDDLFQGLF